jgi:hypothetical protein
MRYSIGHEYQRETVYVFSELYDAVMEKHLNSAFSAPRI